jgi:hypothetical protein
MPFIRRRPFWTKRVPLEAIRSFPGVTSGIVKGRSIEDGYTRGWGLQYGDLLQKVLGDPLYIEGTRLIRGRSVQEVEKRANIFLLLKFYIPKLPPGDIIEFGSFRGASAIFIAKICAELGIESRVWALDTFSGMPKTEKDADAHNAGDFRNTNLEELQNYSQRCGLGNLHWVQGLFEETAEGVLAKSRKMVLAHIDCDIRSAVQYSYNVVKDRMVDGGYIVFDDATASSCLGATEVVEDEVIRRDGQNCEQIYPHFVFRAWSKPDIA